jgi:predicted esterase
MKNKILLIPAFIFCWAGSLAQTTGSFDTSITFMSQPRSLSLYVPTNYDPGNSYGLMICLHGLGDNGLNYRNGLINSLNWKSIFPNTIFIFPDGGSDNNKDFYTPAGDEQIISECISLADQLYSIDAGNIVLQGFSLGGRSALKYGLENPADFKGLLLNTPAMQGIQDVLNKPPGSLVYNYANAPGVPIYMVVGGNDLAYVGSVGRLNDILMKNDAVVKFTIVAGLGHTIPLNSITAPAEAFFDNPYTSQYDLDIFAINNDERSCGTQFSPSCFVRNKGSDTISAFELHYNIGSAVHTYNWSGSLGPYQHTLVNIPAVTANTGKQLLSFTVGDINTSFTDTVTFNNNISDSVKIYSGGNTLPLVEGIEGSMNDWISPVTGSLFSWSVDNSVKRFGQNSMSILNSILYFNTQGDTESFISPVINVSTVSLPVLTFDLAFNYQQYTPPYVVNTIDFADTLLVEISTDCGKTFQAIYKKGGADLATTDNPILNPLDLPQCVFYPSAAEWRREEINLSLYSTATEATVRFSCISGMGGCMYIDNIYVGKSTVSVEEPEILSGINMFPNPAGGEVILSSDQHRITQVDIYDGLGRLVLSKQITSIEEYTINISELKSGIYHAGIITSGGICFKKLLVNKR